MRIIESSCRYLLTASVQCYFYLIVCPAPDSNSCFLFTGLLEFVPVSLTTSSLNRAFFRFALF